jgi:hypothetical protein
MSKSETISNDKNTNAQNFWFLNFDIGICLEIGVWDLEFSQWDCRALFRCWQRQSDIHCAQVGRPFFPFYNLVPVSVAIDSLKGNGGERAVKDLRCQNAKAVYCEYSANYEDKKPMVQVELIVPPGDDY